MSCLSDAVSMATIPSGALRNKTLGNNENSTSFVFYAKASLAAVRS